MRRPRELDHAPSRAHNDDAISRGGAYGYLIDSEGTIFTVMRQLKHGTIGIYTGTGVDVLASKVLRKRKRSNGATRHDEQPI